VLGLRILVGAVLIPVVLLINHAGGLVFALFVAALAGLGSFEFYRMFSKAGAAPSGTIGITGSACICLAFHFGGVAGAAWVLTVFVCVVLLAGLASQGKDTYARSVNTTVIGALYTGWLLGYFILIRNWNGMGGGPGDPVSDAGRTIVYLVLVLTWSYDSIAYLIGSFLGKHIVFGSISPSKTVEGTLGGLAGCVAAALISRATFATFLHPGHAVLLGLFVGAVAQGGDLVESMIKRSTASKDSSSLIPGHGGLLDRFDSLLFTGPGIYLYLRMIAGWKGL
jgi:phosphatidate cytidylyltransferase